MSWIIELKGGQKIECEYIESYDSDYLRYTIPEKFWLKWHKMPVICIVSITPKPTNP